MRMINKLKFARVKQYFNDTMISDIENHIKHQFLNSDIRERLSDKEKIGRTVGSRGIANLNIIVKSLIRELKAVGKKPFIIRLWVVMEEQIQRDRYYCTSFYYWKRYSLWVGNGPSN